MNFKGNRDRILRSAVELFREHGNLCASNREICDRAGISAASAVQACFNNRNELLLEVVRAERKHYRETRLTILATGSPAFPHAGLKTFLRASTVGVDDRELKAGFLFANAAGEVRQDQPDLRAELNDALVEIEQALISCIRTIKNHGAFAPGPEVASAHLLARLQAVRLKARLSQKRDALVPFMKECAVYTGVNDLAF